MKKGFLRSTIVLVSTILVAATLGGCSNKQSKGEDQFSKIKENGYVVVGIDDSFVPMGYKDEKGNIVGFDVDLAKEAVKRIGLEVKFQSIDWSMKETELNSKNIDLIWNGYTITDERKEKLNFTKPYLENRQVIITLANSNINAKKELEGRKVGTQNGSSSLDAINKEPDLVKSLKGGEPVLFDTNNEALMDLEAGRTEAVVADEILARYYIKERGESKYKILQEDFGKEEYGVGVRKQDEELSKKLNSALDDMKKDGTSAKISEKWFGKDIIK